jgi:hypothetical protein
MNDRCGRGRCDGILNGDVVGCCLPRLDSLCWLGLDEKASWAWTTECVSVVGSSETNLAASAAASLAVLSQVIGRVGWPRPAAPQHSAAPHPINPRGPFRAPCRPQRTGRHPISRPIVTKVWVRSAGQLILASWKTGAAPNAARGHKQASPTVSKAGKAMAHEARLCAS